MRLAMVSLCWLMGCARAEAPLAPHDGMPGGGPPPADGNGHLPMDSSLPIDAPPPVRVDAPAGCPPGTIPFQGVCATFGGVYESNLNPSCPPCNDANAYAAACGCPAGFVPANALRVINDCGGAQHRGDVTVCQVPAYVATSDWAGAWELDDAVACSQGCRAPNPYTGGCSCPVGSATVVMRTLVDVMCGSNSAVIGGVIGICINPAGGVQTVGGAYQLDDGNLCRTSNPLTAACSCPAGTVPQTVRAVVDTGVPNQRRGSLIAFCRR